MVLPTIRVKNRVIRVSSKLRALEPCCPPEHRPLSKGNNGNIRRFDDTWEVPVEFLVHIVQDPIFQAPEAGPDRDEAFQICEAHRTHQYPELQLHLVLSFTGNRVDAKTPGFGCLTQTALVLLRNLH